MADEEVAWAREPVWASLAVGNDAIPHLVGLDGGEIRTTSHDEDDHVLVALGGAPCVCHILAATWQTSRHDPLVLPFLLQPLPRGAVERALQLALAGGAPVPGARAQPDQDAIRRSQARRTFFAAVATLDFAFRSALARHVAESVAERWDDVVADGTPRLAIEHAVRLALRTGLAHVDQAKLELEFTDDPPAPVTISSGAATVAIGRRWLIDVAAAGAVGSWWRALWD